MDLTYTSKYRHDYFFAIFFISGQSMLSKADAYRDVELNEVCTFLLYNIISSAQFQGLGMFKDGVRKLFLSCEKTWRMADRHWSTNSDKVLNH